MKYKTTLVWLLTGLFLAGALLIGYVAQPDAVALPISLEIGASAEGLKPWQGEDGSWYFFLPGYGALSDSRMVKTGGGRITVNGVSLEEGASCEGFPLDTPLEVLWETGGKQHRFTVKLLRSGEMPALYLDVKSGSMDYIHQELGNKESGSLRLYGADGALLQSLDLEHLETRGNSTTGRLKKPYNIKLKEEADLLDMGAARRWVLLANSYDDSHLRTRAVFDFARELGLPYSPESRWVDLYLNGEYAGLYLLCERNEVHPQRVSLTEEGSFLVSKEWEWRMAEKGQPFVMTEDKTALRIHYSNLDDVALTAALQSVENAILAPDGIDPVTGKHWQDLIDLDSWAKKYLVEEVFGNVDGLTLSQFFYRDGDGKVFAGPVWDYDMALGNTIAYPAQVPNLLFANREDVHGSRWYPALYSNPEFYGRMLALYEEEFLPALEVLLSNTIPGYELYIEKAAAMDALRWSSRWHTVDPAGETAKILSYMEGRINFLDSLWLRGEPHLTVLVDIGGGVVMRYALRPGESLPPLPEYADTPETDYQGWYLAGEDTPFDVSQPIWEDTAIRLKSVAIPPETVEAEISPLRYAPAALFGLLLAALAIWDYAKNKGRSYERKQHKVSP